MQFLNVRTVEDGLKSREEDHKNTSICFFNDNTEKLEALHRWFPVVYVKLKKEYPVFYEYPDNCAPGVVMSVNRTLQGMIPCGSYSELEFETRQLRCS